MGLAAGTSSPTKDHPIISYREAVSTISPIVSTGEIQTLSATYGEEIGLKKAYALYVKRITITNAVTNSDKNPFETTRQRKQKALSSKLLDSDLKPIEESTIEQEQTLRATCVTRIPLTSYAVAPVKTKERTNNLEKTAEEAYPNNFEEPPAYQPPPKEHRKWGGGRITLTRTRRRRKEALSPDEAKRRRQDYQKQYYLTHREKAKEYQRQYNLLHKKKQRLPGAKGRNAMEFKRDIMRMTYNTHDLMHAPAEKTLKMLVKILAGEKMFTM